MIQHVNIKSSAGLELTVLLGEASPTLSDGTATWETVPRPQRQSITRHTGRLPHKQTIPVLFDGYVNGASQEDRISKLQTMQSQSHTVKVTGQALKTGFDWVIEGVDWDDQAEWMSFGDKAHRVRQAAVIHLLEYVKDTVIKTPANPDTKTTKKKKPAKKTKTPAGMNAKQIAKIEFNDPDKWHKIYDDNPILGPPSPRRIIPKGTELVIIDGKIPFFTVP